MKIRQDNISEIFLSKKPIKEKGIKND